MSDRGSLFHNMRFSVIEHPHRLLRTVIIPAWQPFKLLNNTEKFEVLKVTVASKGAAPLF